MNSAILAGFMKNACHFVYPKEAALQVQSKDSQPSMLGGL